MEASNQGSMSPNCRIGPNVNIRLSKKNLPTREEKEYFKRKIKMTKKTELCKNWELYNDCFFKDNCSFAHGEGELRVKYTGFNFKFKTKNCKAFKEKMYCPFGSRCQYRHFFSEHRLFTYKYINFVFCKEILSENQKYENLKNYEFYKILDYIKMNMKFDV